MDKPYRAQLLRKGDCDVRDESIRTCLRVIYSCGLRLREGTHLQGRDIDSDRTLIHGRNSKGGKNRYLPRLPQSLELLRTHWDRKRHRYWLVSG